MSGEIIAMSDSNLHVQLDQWIDESRSKVDGKKHVGRVELHAQGFDNHPRHSRHQVPPSQ
jgi:hypothetical protein